MTIEQKSELNRFVDPSIPLTWTYRWRQSKITLPIWIFFLLCFLEIGLFKSWLADKFLWDRLAVLLGIWPVMILFSLGVAEIQTRIQQRSKRVIQIKDDKIIVKPAKNQFIRWKHISKFQFEPIPEAPGLMKLKLFLHGRPNQKPSGRAFWSMVLENQSQLQDLVHCLQTKKTEAPTEYEIEILERPALPVSTAPFLFLGMALNMGGLFLLLHGMPLLLIGLGNGNHHHSEDDSQFTPNEMAKLGRFLLKHFHSFEELRHFYIVAGVVLTFLGLLLLIWGWLLMNRKTQAAPALTAA